MNYSPTRFNNSFRSAYLKQTHLLHIIVLVLSIVVIYWQVYKFNFLIGWDDQWFITNHYTENGLNWDNLYEILTEYYHGQYAPLNQIYYTLLYSIIGYNPAYFHVTSILLHIVNVILLYFFLNTITIKITSKSATQIKQTSFIAALLFAVLPINIEPVAWISASKVLIYALFYLLSLILYCKYLTTFKSVYFYLTLLFFIFSFGAKEQAILLPFCLILVDYAYNRNLKNKMIWLEKLPYFILTLLFGIVTLHSQELEYQGGSFYPGYQRVPLAFYTLSEYFTKCLIPVNVSYLYPFPFQIGDQVPWWLWIYVFAIPLIIYCFYSQLKVRWFRFGLLFFFIHIILTINIFSLARFSVTADRYAYLSTVGLCYLISLLFISNLYKTRFFASLIIAGILYIGVLITYSSVHIVTWTDAYTLKAKLKNTIEERDDFNELKHLK